MRSLILLNILLGLVIPTFSQTFRGEAALPSVEADGFYRILISPEVSSYLNSGFSNARIFDHHGKEVPYLFQKEIPVLYTQSFKEYEILENKQKKNCCTNLILKNPDNNAINNINLSIRNAEVTKHATLLGSDDQKNWFALKEHFILNNLNNPNKTSEIKIVDFPLSNYTYYLLQIEDSTSAPLNILKAGYYEINSEGGQFAKVTSFKVAKSDSIKLKKSFIQINFDKVQVIDKLTITMVGTPYFLRKASLQIKRESLDNKGKVSHFYESIMNFELSSKQESIIELPGIRSDNFLITIENEDNPLLEVSSIKTYQLNRYLIAWLVKGNQYKLKLGNADLQSPSYDLGFFKDSIPKEAQLLTIGAVDHYNEQKPLASTTTMFFTNRAIIWVAIVLVIGVLGIMSVKLIREVSAKKN